MDLTEKERQYIRQLDFYTQNPKLVEEEQPNREFVRGGERPKMSPVGMDGLGGFSVLTCLLKEEPIYWSKFT